MSEKAKTQPVVVVDAFTSIPFRGNPAAVCVMPNFPDDRTMQRIASEMNLSETAFLVKENPLEFRLRWFTPTHEVDLCGHATLASSHHLLESGEAKEGDVLRFHTRSGELRASIGAEGIELDFPMLPGEHLPITDSLKACLGVPIRAAEFNGTNILVEVEDMDELAECKPNFKAIATLEAQGLIVTTATGCGAYDFASRYFAPQVGVLEDPVCGSAHCFLAPYWAAEMGQTKFRAFQASQRSGVLEVRIEGDRVFIGGKAVTTLRGILELGGSHAFDHAA